MPDQESERRQKPSLGTDLVPGTKTPVIRLGISACLLGQPVRYDGGHKLDHYLVDTLGRYVEWIPVCPEVEVGLPVPRETMRLEGDPENPRLVAPKSGTDYTDRMVAWARMRADELADEGLHGFVFKKNSPIPGLYGFRDRYHASGTRRGSTTLRRRYAAYIGRHTPQRCTHRG